LGEQALHLLFVGADPADVTLVRKLLLRAMGHGASRLDQVSSTPEALERLIHTDYDLILLDDRIDSRRAIARELRRRHKIIPTVLLTSKNENETADEVAGCGLSDYLHRSGLNEFKLSRILRCVLCARKREEASRRAEDQLRKLSRAVEQSADLVIITNREGIIEYVNPAFEELTGYSRDEILGRKPSLLKSGQQNPAYYKDLWETILAGKAFRGVLVNKKKNGTLFHAEKTITPVRDSTGKITHFISNDRDVTERHNLEAQLRQVQKMDAIGQLAGGVAHDFNNLLMVVSSYAELALDSLTPEHSLHRNIREILHAARRAADLTRQLLAFSRTQAQSLRLLDLNEVVQDLGRILPRVIREDIELALVTSKDLGRIKADPVQMEQIIINLAVNARDAMPVGGKLTIETASVHLDDAYVHLRPIVPPGDYVLLTITDSGLGIPPEHLPHIFEPFFTTKQEGKGTGLGLATVYGIVKQSGGFIWVYSEPGLGTTFKIYFPRVAEKQPRVTAPPRADSYARGSETILYVEDEEAVRLPSCEFLTRCGYKVLPAPCGTDAIEIAGNYAEEIHLMITDVIMPGISGTETAEQLVTLRPKMKVLYVSGYGHPTLLRHGIQDLQPVFLEKPFTLKALASRVREILDANSPSLLTISHLSS
jgi:two-component system, cell cycle sensor histidine kinase and response regulator CckA